MCPTVKLSQNAPFASSKNRKLKRATFRHWEVLLSVPETLPAGCSSVSAAVHVALKLSEALRPVSSSDLKCHQKRRAQSSPFSTVFLLSISVFLSAGVDSAPPAPKRLRLLAPGWYSWIAGRSWCKNKILSAITLNKHQKYYNDLSTLFRSLSFFPMSSFLFSFWGFSGFSEWTDSTMLSSFFFSKAFSFLKSSSRFRNELSPSCLSLRFRLSSSCRLRRSFSLSRRSFSRSLSRSRSRSRGSFRPSSSHLQKKRRIEKRKKL